MASSTLPEPPGVRVRVPGKINLSLAVGGRGADGYHQLATIFQAVSLYDDLIASWADPGVVELTMVGEGAENLPVDDTNLAVRAARLLAARYGGADAGELGVRMHVRKGIPIAGGMAGGSADAAAALLAASVLWDLDISPDELRELGAGLGSDVPFCLMGGSAVGTGRGERLVPALSRGTYHWVLVVAERGLSTPAVFRRFDELGLGSAAPELPAGLMTALAGADARALGAALRNDLQAPALSLRPDLRRVLDAGLDHGALGAIVSGSGPTCAFLAADESSAVDLSVALSADGVGRAIRRVAGPVPGARVLA